MAALNVFVCIKEIQNPEIVPDLFRVDEERKEVIPVRDMPLVTSPFDEQALEAALRLRDAGVEVNITAVTLGPDSARGAIKRALAMGADSGIHISDKALEQLDAVACANALCLAMQQAGPIGLVLTGRQAADWDAGIVGCAIGEILDLPVISFAKDLKIEGAAVVVERVLDDGEETVQAQLPCVVTVANELGKPRKASLRETMRAAKKPVQSIDAAALGNGAELLAQSAARGTRDKLFIPVKDSHCEMLTGASPQQIAEQLIARLREARSLG